MLKKIIVSSILFTFGVFLLLPVLVNGQGLVPQSVGGCPPNYEGNCGNYDLNSFVELAVNVSRWILGIVGSLTLLMFIYGGIVFLISAGSSEKINEAKKIIIAAIVGLLIVLASFLIIKFVLKSMGIEWNGEQIQF